MIFWGRIPFLNTLSPKWRRTSPMSLITVVLTRYRFFSPVFCSIRFDFKADQKTCRYLKCNLNFLSSFFKNALKLILIGECVTNTEL